MCNRTRNISDREKLVRRYFHPIPPRPGYSEAKKIALGAGSLLVIALVFSLFASALFSRIFLGFFFGICTALTGLKAVKRFWQDRANFRRQLRLAFPRPTDQEVDMWFEDALARLRNHSLEKLGLTEEECSDVELPPIRSPLLALKAGLAPQDVRAWATGDDGVARFGVYEIIYIWLAETHIGIFRCDYNFIRDVHLNDETHTPEYHHILFVSTREVSSSVALPTGESLSYGQEFQIELTSGRAFRFPIHSSGLRRLTGAEIIPDSGAERAVRALQTKIRD